MTTSPLSQVSPNSLQEVFNKNPWEMDLEKEVRQIVEVLQADRAKWLDTPEGKGQKQVKKVDAPLDLKLDDLDV